MSRHVETFLEMMAVERGAAANTLDAYGRDLADLADFLRRRGVAPIAATGADIAAYLRSQNDAGMATRTQARRLSCLRQFYRFAFAEGWRGDDPTSRVDMPRLGRGLPRLLSEAEVDRLLEAARTLPDPQGPQMTALLELLYATGLRVSELVGLPFAAVARDPAVLIVRGKGDKERMVPLSDPARTALTAWKDVRAKAMRLKTSGAVHVKDLAPGRIMASVDGDHGTYDVTILKGATFGGLNGKESLAYRGDALVFCLSAHSAILIAAHSSASDAGWA
jgi:integrase/recombinase XerD